MCLPPLGGGAASVGTPAEDPNKQKDQPGYGQPEKPKKQEGGQIKPQKQTPPEPPPANPEKKKKKDKDKEKQG